MRALPELTALTRPFWTGGRAGTLLIQHCSACDYWVHPPGPLCPRCLGPVTARAVSGRATVLTYTVNHQRWHPQAEVPYVVAIVELAEQEGLRLTTNVVGCAPENVSIGMPVRVTFEQAEDVFLPLFRPS